MPHGIRAARCPHLHLLMILQIQVQFRVRIERKQRIVMGFRQAFYIELRIRAVHVGPGVQVNIMGACQRSVNFHTVITRDIVIYLGDQYAFQAAGISLRSQIHLDLVAAAEGDVAASFKFALLFQRRPLVYRDLICGIYSVIAVHPHIFPYAAALAFHLVGHVQIRISVINLPFFGSDRDIFANIHVGLCFYDLCGCHIRRNLEHAADVHMVVPCFVIIGAGNDPVGCRHIAPARMQLRAFLQFRAGIHLHLVVRVRPGHA